MPGQCPGTALRKAGIVLIEDDRVQLSSEHYRAETDAIMYDNELLHLDTDLCDVF